jgi:hypothetical protein
VDATPLPATDLAERVAALEREVAELRAALAELRAREAPPVRVDA